MQGIMRKQKSVALLIETSNAYARGLLSGIAAYIHEHELWSIYMLEQERGAAPPSWLKNWNGDGLIARIENEQIAEVVRKLKIPVVDVSAARQVPNIPWVETNDRAIARLAYEHFRERGFENFAFCGERDFQWSILRREAFQECVSGDGYECHILESPRHESRSFSPNRERSKLAKWVLSLPRPIGVFACYDIKAQQVLDVCREHQVKVPGELALLGVDNDELLCDLCTPPLSSIIPAAHQTGRKAAELLDAMMNGATVGSEARLIDPVGVATRQSTDVLATRDADISAAVRFIQDHFCEGINVHDVLKAVPLSRRAFESRFQAIIGRTPHQEIIRRRIERVRQLLVETDLTLAEIAKRTGFQNQEYMSVAFRRSTNTPPAAFRKSARTNHPW
jgi:LacI family transcriptional regulator